MSASIFTQLAGGIALAPHQHVAALYRGRAEAFRFVQFLAEGLERRDLCHYLAPRSFHEEMVTRLRALRADLEVHIQNKTLRLHEGLQDYRELCQSAEQVFLDAERERAPGVRWLEEGSWPKAAGFPMQEFFDFHAALNYQVKHYPSVALCQYDLNETEPQHVLSAIAVHRHLIVDQTLVRDNPFYIPAEKFIPLDPRARDRDLARVFREVGFDTEKLLAALVGYGRLPAGS
ncbi:MAG: MEDS domain-containing protein [Acidobacteria bacterium]|nr:MEDS domain-containing protein [Acidobacteriota bacterium]